ncbi:MAG: hypothetical protein EZS28_046506, partial [Streblomastix strix]
EELKQYQDSLIAKMSKLFRLSTDQVILILIYEQWNVENSILSFFADQDSCLKQAGIQRIIKEEKMINDDYRCPVYSCLIQADNDAILPCGHRFCKDCAFKYINTQFYIDTQTIKFGCLEGGCNGQIFPSMIHEALSNNTFPELSEQERLNRCMNAVQQYDKSILDSYIKSLNVQLVKCKNSQCSYFVIRYELHNNEIRCLCVANVSTIHIYQQLAQ